MNASTDPMIVLARRLDPIRCDLIKWMQDNVESVEELAGARFAVYGHKTSPDATSTLPARFVFVHTLPGAFITNGSLFVTAARPENRDGQRRRPQMHIILRSGTSRLVNGLLLAAGQRRMRIVVERRKDTLELRLVRGQWFSNDGSRMEIAFLSASAAAQPVVRQSRVQAAGAAF